MPVVLKEKLPSALKLQFSGFPVYFGEESEKVVNIAIVNLMPNKEETEAQLLKALSSSYLNVNVTFVYPKTHNHKISNLDHFEKYYKTIDEIKNLPIDGMIITGAPIEKIKFDKIYYWDELKEIMDYAQTLNSTIYLCWASMAALYRHYDINSKIVDQKVFGVFPHKTVGSERLLENFPEVFEVPQSRYFYIDKEPVKKVKELDILAECDDAGVCLLSSKDGKHIYMTGHLEYDLDNLKKEYERDINNRIYTAVPKNYFADDNPNRVIISNWNCTKQRFFSNWLQHHVVKGI